MGSIRDVESLSLAVLRLIGEEARKDRTARVIAQLPVDVGTYLLNEKRDGVNTIQERNKVRLLIIPNPAIETPNYSIRRVRDDETTLPENVGISYQMAATAEEIPETAIGTEPKPAVEEPAVKGIVPATPAPTASTPPRPPAGESLWSRFWAWLTGGGSAEDASAERSPPRASRGRRRGQKRGASQQSQARKRSDQGARRRQDAKRGSGDGKQKKRGRAAGGQSKRSSPEAKREAPEGKRTRDNDAKRTEKARGAGRSRRTSRRRREAPAAEKAAQAQPAAKSETPIAASREAQKETAGSAHQSTKGFFPPASEPAPTQKPAHDASRDNSAVTQKPDRPPPAREAQEKGLPKQDQTPPAKTTVSEPSTGTQKEPASPPRPEPVRTEEKTYTIWSSTPSEGPRGPGRDE